MIKVRLQVTITAADDNEADTVIERLVRQSQRWPATPVIWVTETERYLLEDQP